MHDLPRDCPNGTVPCDAWVAHGACPGGDHSSLLSRKNGPSDDALRWLASESHRLADPTEPR